MQLVDLVFDENDLWGPGGPGELHDSPGLHHHDETVVVPLSATKFFDQEGPTSSSSEGAPSGSSGRDSTTPGATSQSGATVDPSSAAAGASWMQMAPNLPDFPPQSAGFYSVTPQQQAVAPQWHSSVQWHSAFSSAAPRTPAASQQVVSKGGFRAVPAPGVAAPFCARFRRVAYDQIDHFVFCVSCHLQSPRAPSATVRLRSSAGTASTP
jgi:hypothetical protein